jgi:hypothetical protein
MASFLLAAAVAMLGAVVIVVPLIFRRDASRTEIFTWIGISIALFIVSAFQAYLAYVNQKTEANVGTLRAPSALGPNPSGLSIRLGTSCVTLKRPFPTGSNTTDVFGWIDGVGRIPLFLSERDGYLFITTDVRDESGDLVAVLTNNEWQVNPENTFDRNYSSNALEVIDEQGEVVLQVITTKSDVLLSAVLRDSDGKTLVVGSPDDSAESTRLYGTGGVIEIYGKGKKSSLKFPFHIPKYFKYPSQNHLGELTEYGKDVSTTCP